MPDLPAQCSTVLTAGRTDDTNVAAAALKVVASKEAGPPLPRLDPAALRALSGTGMPLPDRNPNR
jgi:hypothetical protein